MKQIQYILYFLIVAQCSNSTINEAWLKNLNSFPLYTKDDLEITILPNGNVNIPENQSKVYTFQFSDAKSETEAFYKQSGKSGYTGLKIQNGALYQVGTKADTTSGASLSEKKDFIDFTKTIKELGTKK